MICTEMFGNRARTGSECIPKVILLIRKDQQREKTVSCAVCPGNAFPHRSRRQLAHRVGNGEATWDARFPLMLLPGIIIAYTQYSSDHRLHIIGTRRIRHPRSVSD